MDMDLEQKAIMRLREAADTSERFYKAPLIVTTSGGKDSSVCVALAEKAGIDFEVMHNHTTVDAPETVYFIRREFKRLEEKRRKMHGQLSALQGRAGDYVEPHSAKAHASDAARPLLLLHSQRARRSRPLHNDGRSLG